MGLSGQRPQGYIVTIIVPYTATCALCDFQREIDELADVFEFRDTHQATYGEDHVIEWELIEDSDQATG